MKSTLTILIAGCMLFAGCNSSDSNDCGLPALESKSNCSPPADQMGLTALELMDLYVVEEELTVEKMANNLWYVIIEPGGDVKPGINQSVTVDYMGYFRNDCRFDGTNDISFPLSRLIKGWQQGIPLVGKCGTVKLIVPPSLGYGNNPPAGIPKGEPLIFDINLLDF